MFVGKNTGYISKLQSFISEHRMESQVLFLKDLPEKDLAGIYQLATLSVYISVFEGFGLPVIESMACGCPVITSGVSVMPETAGDSAVLCNPSSPGEIGEKVRMLLEDKDIWRSYVVKGTDRAKLFNPEIYAEKLMALYSQLKSESL